MARARDRVRADVGVRGGHIAAVGDCTVLSRRNDAKRIVAPGFIDTHTHDDRYLSIDLGMPAKLSQGVTTVVTGNCGISLAPWRSGWRSDVPAPANLLGVVSDFPYETFGAYLTTWNATHPPSTRPACGLQFLRRAPPRWTTLNRPATASEVAQMQNRAREAMQSGAIGPATGTAYLGIEGPQRWTNDLGGQRVLREYGGVYASHIRDEGDRIFAALRSLAVGAAGDAPVLISHHKLIGPRNRPVGRDAGWRTSARWPSARKWRWDCYPMRPARPFCARTGWRWCPAASRDQIRAVSAVRRARFTDIAQDMGWPRRRRGRLAQAEPSTSSWMKPMWNALAYPGTM